MPSSDNPQNRELALLVTHGDGFERCPLFMVRNQTTKAPRHACWRPSDVSRISVLFGMGATARRRERKYKKGTTGTLFLRRAIFCSAADPSEAEWAGVATAIGAAVKLHM